MPVDLDHNKDRARHRYSRCGGGMIFAASTLGLGARLLLGAALAIELVGRRVALHADVVDH
jgi:hypothetical protein